MAAIISFIEFLLFHSSLSLDHFRYVKVTFTQVIMSITAIQLYLIIRATDGYKGDIQFILRNISADLCKLTNIFSRKILYKLATKAPREEKR